MGDNIIKGVVESIDADGLLTVRSEGAGDPLTKRVENRHGAKAGDTVFVEERGVDDKGRPAYRTTKVEPMLVVNLAQLCKEVGEFRTSMARQELPPSVVGGTLGHFRGFSHEIAKLPGAGDEERELAKLFASLPFSQDAFDTLGEYAGVAQTLEPMHREAARLLDKWRKRLSPGGV
jgi:hypothetical protein